MTEPVRQAVNRWLPASPCGPGCLDDGVTASGRRTARLALRMTAVATVLVAGLGVALLVPVLPARATERVQRGWALGVLVASGVRVTRRGPAAPRGALLVGNHVSWLDVLALHAVAPVRMLAKREVRSWPLLGTMAACAGTVFLDRERLRALPGAVATLAGALRAGTTIGVFPEGTTRCGRDLGPFRPAAFQAALDAGAPVVPVALRYHRSDRPAEIDSTAAFVGDDTLWSSLRRVLGVRRLEIEVSVLPAIDPAAVRDEIRAVRPERAAPRRALARRCAEALVAVLPADPLGHPAAEVTGTTRSAAAAGTGMPVSTVVAPPVDTPTEPPAEAPAGTPTDRPAGASPDRELDRVA